MQDTYKIVFSIPVHERLEVVIDQLVNIKRFNPDCGIVIHISPSLSDSGTLSFEQFIELTTRIRDVYINPERVRTGNYDIIQAHLSNFSYISKTVEFEYFALCSSNELFIKGGLYQHISPYDCLVWKKEEKDYPNWKHFKAAKRDIALRRIMDDLGCSTIVGSQVEGSVYRKELFERIYTKISKRFDHKDIDEKYAREEVYFSTVFWALDKKETEHYNVCKDVFTWCPWNRSYTMNVLIRELRRIKETDNKFFSVKRVDRDIHNHIRSVMRQDAQYLDYENSIFSGLLSLKEETALKLYIEEFRFEINAHLGLIHKLMRHVTKILDSIWKS